MSDLDRATAALNNEGHLVVTAKDGEQYTFWAGSCGEPGCDCRDIVTQLSAATKALEQTSFTLVAAGLTWCVSDPERAAAEGYTMDDVKKRRADRWNRSWPRYRV